VVRVAGARVVLRWVIDDQRSPTDGRSPISPVEADTLAVCLLAGLRTKHWPACRQARFDTGPVAQGRRSQAQ
jgi:hypothetical protein